MTAGEAAREFYREQGRQQERQRMTETKAIRQNYNLGVIAGEARERERIIKLLNGDDSAEVIFTWFEQESLYEGLLSETQVKNLSHYLIALIKVESQKDNETVVLLTEGEK